MRATLPTVTGTDAPDRPCIVSVQAAAHAAQCALWAESGALPLTPAAAAWPESVVTCLLLGRPNLFRGLPAPWRSPSISVTVFSGSPTPDPVTEFKHTKQRSFSAPRTGSCPNAVSLPRSVRFLVRFLALALVWPCGLRLGPPSFFNRLAQLWEIPPVRGGFVPRGKANSQAAPPTGNNYGILPPARANRQSRPCQSSANRWYMSFPIKIELR